MGIDAQMFVRTKAHISDEDLKRYRYDLAEAFGPTHFMIWSPNKTYLTKDHHSLMRIDEYTQDGEPIHPEPGETFLRVTLTGRYYGEGYERGDFPLYYSIARYLEMKIPGAEVWYGGDSSGICPAIKVSAWSATLFDHVERERLWWHFVQVGNQPYRRGLNPYMKPDAFDRETPTCGICEVKMTRVGFGKTWAKFMCFGCELTIEHGAHAFKENPK